MGRLQAVLPELAPLAIGDEEKRGQLEGYSCRSGCAQLQLLCAGRKNLFPA